VELKAGTSVYITYSKSGYKGFGIILGLAYGETYLVEVENHTRSILVVPRQHLNVVDSSPEEVEEAPDEDPAKSKKAKKQKEIEEFLSEALEGRIDDQNPTDGRRGKGRRGGGRRLPSRPRR
jgi:hypothetical protein